MSTIGHEAGHEGLVQVKFSLGSDPDHSYRSEGLWTRNVGRGLFRIENIPFLVYGVSLHDLVRAKKRGAVLRFTRVAKYGGHSTYRVFLRAETVPEGGRVQRGERRLRKMGCSIERAGKTWFAVDVPPAVDVYAAYELMEKLEEAGVWEFEEGHCGHRAN